MKGAVDKRVVVSLFEVNEAEQKRHLYHLYFPFHFIIILLDVHHRHHHRVLESHDAGKTHPAAPAAIFRPRSVQVFADPLHDSHS